jgi:hypothetical protein
MGTLLPLITALIGQAPNVVSLILNLIHPDGSQTVVAVLASADTNDAAAQTAIQQLQAAVAAKNAAAAKPATPATPAA